MAGFDAHSLCHPIEAGSLASLTHHVTHALVRLAQREGHQVRVGSVVEVARRPW